MPPNQLVTESPYIRRARRERPTCRLFCFPFAGAGASAFRDWPRLMPDTVELVAIQLPGREDRFREAPFAAMEPLVMALGQVMRPYLPDLPVALFGHSGGALLAFEVARLLAARSCVSRLVVSGHRAPHLPSRAMPLRYLPDEELLTEIAALDGTDPRVLTDRGLRRVVLPALRADVTMWEGYRLRPGPPLRCPVTALGGDQDPLVPEVDLREWAEHTAGTFGVRLFPGNHFFLHESRDDVVATIGRELVEMDRHPALADGGGR